MKKTVFTIKRVYNKTIDKVLGFEGRIDYASAQYDENIAKLAKARTACVKAGLTDKVTELEQRIIKQYTLRKQLQDKKAELIAKVASLEAERDAMETLSTLNISSPDNIITDCNMYIKQLEAELDTLNFLNKQV